MVRSTIFRTHVRFCDSCVSVIMCLAMLRHRSPRSLLIDLLSGCEQMRAGMRGHVCSIAAQAFRTFMSLFV